MPIFSRAHVSIGPGLCQVIFPVFQLNHAVRPDRIQKFIHGADADNGCRSSSVRCIGSRFFGMGRRSHPASEAGDHKKQRQKQWEQSFVCFLHHSFRPFPDRWFNLF